MSGFDLRRLRRGELIAGTSAVLLGVFMFALDWYALSSSLGQTAAQVGAKTSYSGWSALNHLRYLLLATIIVALALAFSQAAARAPAMPVSFAVVVTVLGILSTLALIYRVLVNPPGSGLDQQAGAYLGLLATAGIAYGGYASMREEGGRDLAPEEIEVVKLSSERGRS